MELKSRVNEFSKPYFKIAREGWSRWTSSLPATSAQWRLRFLRQYNATKAATGKILDYTRRNSNQIFARLSKKTS